MKTTFPAVWCLLACLCGCAGSGRLPENQPPAENRPRWWERADRFAGRARDRLTEIPALVQGAVETAVDSDVVTCLLPVIAVAGFVVAFFSGGGCGSGFGSSAATPAP
jgi:hypothetical protein